ncbi:MAG: hypothetical protein ISR72_10735 [Methylobacter sp.]|nr:hypothetical protein [Methylobacter sp.]
MDKINYQAYTLHEVFDIFSAASLWCERNPHRCHEWGSQEYIEVRGMAVHILRHTMNDEIYAENYPSEKREAVKKALPIVVEKFNKGLFEFLKESKPFFVSRDELKAIAKKAGVKPKFLYFEDTELREFITKAPLDKLDIENTETGKLKSVTEAVGNGGAGSQVVTEPASSKVIISVGVIGDDSDSGERQSQLHLLIWRVHQFLSETKKPTAQKLWNEIQFRHESHDTDRIIQEVDGQQILWCSGYGNEQRQLRSTFNKTLSNLRKSPPL